MHEYVDLIKHIQKEIRKNGFYRKKFSFFLYEWFEYKNKNRILLKRFDQALFENDISVYTKRSNVRDEKQHWDWFDLKSNEAYITFVSYKKTIISQLPYGTLLKMHVVNEPIPTEKLFLQYASKAKEILICSAYVDEDMSILLADVASKNSIPVRFVADVDFNSSLYKRPGIRSKIETVGTFRTLMGANNEEGIMHLKLYVFYMPNNEVVVLIPVQILLQQHGVLQTVNPL